MTPIANSVLGMSPQKSGRLGNQRTNQDHPDDCIAEIGQNTEKSTGDLLSLRLL